MQVSKATYLTRFDSHRIKTVIVGSPWLIIEILVTTLIEDKIFRRLTKIFCSSLKTMKGWYEIMSEKTKEVVVPEEKDCHWRCCGCGFDDLGYQIESRSPKKLEKSCPHCHSKMLGKSLDN